MIISKIRVGWQIKNWLFFANLIIFVVKDLNLPGFDEVHLFDATFIADDCLSWLVNSTVQINDQFVDEASFAFFKEMTEAFLKFLELRCLHN